MKSPISPNDQKQKFKNLLFRIILKKHIRCQGNPGFLPQAHLGKKADSPRNFWGKISNLIGILLWIIVGLNIIITFLIYKILFQ